MGKLSANERLFEMVRENGLALADDIQIDFGLSSDRDKYVKGYIGDDPVIKDLTPEESFQLLKKEGYLVEAKNHLSNPCFNEVYGDHEVGGIRNESVKGNKAGVYNEVYGDHLLREDSD